MKPLKSSNCRRAGVVLAAIALAFLTACSGMQTNKDVASEPKPGSVTYLDTDRFDENLSSLLADKSPSVRVSFLDPPAVGEMPPRMNQWLAAVEENGGKLNVEGQQQGSKSVAAVMALLTVVKEGHAIYKESHKFTPTEYYDAVIHLDEDGVKVKNIDFILR